MTQMYGSVEMAWGYGEWIGVFDLSTVLYTHTALNACLFGVNNYRGFIPLFTFRGCPEDSPLAKESLEHFSWVGWEELARVDWTEAMPNRDAWISEFCVGPNSQETRVGFVRQGSMALIERQLEEDPTLEIRVGDRIFRRPVLLRSDALDNEFPLVMKIMACFAERFGAERVRLVVYFDL